MSLGRLSTRNPVLVNILMVVVLVLGGFSASQLPQEQFAEIPFYFVNVVVPYPGVAADDVERSVTVKIENEMQSLENLDAIRSTTSDGIATVTLEFSQGISDREFDSLYQEVQNRFGNIDLPDGVGDASIDDFSTNDFLPVIEVVLYGDEELDVLRSAAEDLRDRLEGIPDVSRVTLVGSRDRVVMVEASPERMEALGVDIDTVVNAVSARNVNVPAGTITDGRREYLLRTVGEVDDYRRLGDVVVRRSAEGGLLRLDDLATIRRTSDPEGVTARFNGRRSISLQVAKVPGGGSTDIVSEVEERTRELARELPEGLSVEFFNDSTVQIRDSLNVLFTNAALGLVLVVALLLVFIGFRNALMTALGIPLSFAITFVVLELTGNTLNGNSLFALVLVLGLIVDHAIVIVENSFRIQQQGYSKREAAVRGVDQVIVPVVAATATTIAAFLPLTFLPGIIGKFLSIVPITVSVALVASNLEAGLFLPSHYADWPGGENPGTGGRDWFASWRDTFGRILQPLYRHRLITFLGMVAVMAGVFALVPLLQQNLFEAEDASLFYIEVEMPPGTSLEGTDAFVERYEERIVPLVGNGEITGVSSAIGFSSGETENVRESNVAQITVDLADRSAGRTRSVDRIMAEVRDATRDIAGAEDVQFRKQQTGPPTDPPVVFRIFGDDYDSLVAVSDEIKAEMAEYPQLFNITDNLEGGSPELRAVLDPEPASRYGLNPQVLGSFLRASFDGITATTIFEENQETDVVVRNGTGERTAIDEITQVRIPMSDGRFVPFSSVARLEQDRAFGTIQRLDGEREVQIESEAYGTGEVPEVNEAVEELFREELAAEYPGVRLEVGGEFAEFRNLLVDILRVFLVGIFLIYLILATQFKSYTQPVLILFTVPFAFVGVFLFLLISGTSLSTTVIYAGVALVGIAVNDAIVLISFTNRLRAEGVEVSAAVMEAAKTRLRPILLTSFTTIAGLLPTAIGIGGYSVVWGPMASSITFGLLFSTLATLVLIPCIYGLFYDRGGRRIKRSRDDRSASSREK
ncbi:MAG: efflux RND transporter permease subunit [Spirochaetaceae bacterium]